MARNSKDSRGRAEDRFSKAQKTTDAANAQIDVELREVRAKTSRLRAERLAKEAVEVETAVKKKAATPRKKPSR